MKKTCLIWILILIVSFSCGCNPSLVSDRLTSGGNKEYDYHQMYIDKNVEDLTDKDLEAFNEASRVFALYIEDCKSDFEKVKAAHDYIVRNCVYNKEAIDKGTLTNDDFSIYGVLVKGKGVCEGYAKTFKMFMDIAGIDCIIVTGTAGSDNISHAWNMVKLGNDWYHIDVTFDDPYPELEEIVYLYFNVTDEEIEKDHKWNKNVTPQADAVEYNYIHMQGNSINNIDDVKKIIHQMVEDKKGYQSFVWTGKDIIDNNKWSECIANTEISNLNYTYMGVEGRRLYVITLSY